MVQVEVDTCPLGPGRASLRERKRLGSACTCRYRSTQSVLEVVFRMVLQGTQVAFLISSHLKRRTLQQTPFATAGPRKSPLQILDLLHYSRTHQESSPRDTPTPKSELFYFPERRIQRAGAVISVFLSAVLLIGAIVCLTAVADQSTSIRVGMIVLFTCFFAAVVGLLTNARRAEIFGSTAA